MGLTSRLHTIVHGFMAGSVLAVLLVIGATELIVDLLQTNQLERQRIEVVNRLATHRARLEGEINSTLHLTRGLIAYVAINPELDNDKFDLLASEIISVGRNIRNIGLAKDNIITHVFPLAGNEAALGLEYKKIPAQWPAIKRAIDVGGTTVAGPVSLVQGGYAFIARTPIFTRGGLGGHLAVHKPAYWGMASIVIDIPTLFDAAGIAPEQDGIQFALRGKDAMGETGEMIFGDFELFQANPVVQSVLLPNGSWQIGAQPVGGWQIGISGFWQYRLAGWLGALLIGFLIAALLRTREINKSLALHDHLTGLPNRRLLADRFDNIVARNNRVSGGFGIFYIDLDGFKGINDRYGHKVGDGLLLEVAKRMQTSIRASDTVARIGGDEFIVLADDVKDGVALRQVSDHLLSHLKGDVYVDGHCLELHASIGSARYPEDGDDIDQLLKAADHKMYQAKQSGKVYRMDFGR
ncbi:MAG: sensor domain-containing diguanylate cyclase [Candidatus Thiodiazotropha sp. (ex Lucinoma borealis)]|nr:sensor domain-containing diguanylate cyclase [Candidatus Thiodiazotropha sp. (ex Lucinoma borealis)]